MCTFESERAVVVCDIAIGRVKENLSPELAGDVRYEIIDGQGTRVEAADQVAVDRFVALVRQGIDEANGGHRDENCSKRRRGDRADGGRRRLALGRRSLRWI